MYPSGFGGTGTSCASTKADAKAESAAIDLIALGLGVGAGVWKMELGSSAGHQGRFGGRDRPAAGRQLRDCVALDSGDVFLMRLASVVGQPVGCLAEHGRHACKFQWLPRDAHRPQ